MATLSNIPSRSLKDKVAIVTGAGSAGEGIGNGRAAAILLAQDGCHVVCVDSQPELAERTVTMISELGFVQAVAFTGDVSLAADCERIVQKAVTEFGRLDILINNVGIGGPMGTAVDVDVEGWAKGLEVNVTSMMLMAKYAIPVMEKNEPEGGIRGSIVNMGSVAGIKGGTPWLLYPTSKGAVVNMTRAMAFQHGQQGIRVNCVCPGTLYTPMVSSGGMSEELRESRKNGTLLKTEGTGWDCGSAVRFLASPEARWITGTILTVDAGSTSSTRANIPTAGKVINQN